VRICLFFFSSLSMSLTCFGQSKHNLSHISAVFVRFPLIHIQITSDTHPLWQQENPLWLSSAARICNCYCTHTHFNMSPWHRNPLVWGQYVVLHGLKELDCNRDILTVIIVADWTIWHSSFRTLLTFKIFLYKRMATKCFNDHHLCP